VDFGFSSEDESIRQSVRSFMEKECPEEYIQELDREQRFPYDLYEKMAGLGWFGLPFPEEYGGSNLSAMGFVMLSEEMARYSYDIASGYGMVVFLGMHIMEFGTQEQKEFFIPGVIQGKLRLSISITEPNAGSDAAAVSTKAERKGDFFVINGQKVFATGASLKNNYILVVARTDVHAPTKHKGLSIFIVPNNAPGLTIKKLETLGRRIIVTNELFFEDVKVGKKDILGELNDGWKVLLSGLEIERVFASALYVGNAQGALDLIIKYAGEREQFGRPIGTFQAIGHMIADMQTQIDAASLLTYRAARLYDHGKPCYKEVAMSKLFGSETLVNVTNNGMQIMGGYGYMMEYPMQRYFRDARVTTVTAGTSQIQRNIIARTLGLKVK